MTDSGCKADSGPSSVAGPVGSERYNPRTRATSSPRTAIDPIPSAPVSCFATLDP